MRICFKNQAEDKRNKPCRKGFTVKKF
jgi:hypothetical protein